MSGGVAFLMFHEIELADRALCNDDPGYVRYVIAEATFREQIARLRADGMRGVAVGATLAAHADRAKTVAVTFDDGCETDLLVAAPILEDAGFDATFYVTVDHLGRRGYLSRAQLRELADRGFEIGSHAMTHRYLHDLPDDEITSELEGSKRELESITGRRVAQFSCPGGRWDARVLRAARIAGYDSLVTSEVGMNSARTSRFRLRRIAIMRGMNAPEVAALVEGRGVFARQARSAVLGAAKRVLGSSGYERLRGAALRR